MRLKRFALRVEAIVSIIFIAASDDRRTRMILRALRESPPKTLAENPSGPVAQKRAPRSACGASGPHSLQALSPIIVRLRRFSSKSVATGALPKPRPSQFAKPTRETAPA
jgi:hypothetical protein